MMLLTRPLIGLERRLMRFHLKTFASESNNFESAAIRYLPKELFATKITKRHDLKDFKPKPNRKQNTSILKQFLMTHYVELI